MLKTTLLLTRLAKLLPGAVLILCFLLAGCSSELIIEDESVASWMTINNSFAGGDPDHVAGTVTTNTADATRELRTGFLVQLGNFEDCELGFVGIEFESNGSTITDQSIVGSDGTPLLNADGLLFPNKFTWINIISEAGMHDDVPTLPESAFNLYPSQKAINHPCAGLDACAFGGVTCDCDFVLSDLSVCLRGRLLHGELTSFMGFITYWQGAKGYKMTAVQKSGKNQLNNENKFTFKGPIQVEIYREEQVGSEWQMVLVHTFEGGSVNRIRVKSAIKSGNHGMKHDPPWTPVQDD